MSRANRPFLATDFHLLQVEKGGETERKELSVALAEKDALLEELQDGIKAVQVCEMLAMKQMHTCNFFHKLFQRIAESPRQACAMNDHGYLIMADSMDVGGGGQAVHQTSEGARGEGPLPARTGEIYDHQTSRILDLIDRYRPSSTIFVHQITGRF